MKITNINTVLMFLILVLICLFLSPVFAAEGTDGLPEDLRQLQIGDKFIRSGTNEVGLIGDLTGKGRLVILHKGMKAAYYAREENPVFEDDALYTLGDCRCRIEFRDKNVIIMSSDTQLDIGQIAIDVMKGEKSSLFGMTKGKAIFYVLPLFTYKEMKLELKTPTAMVGVRGTKFGIEVETIKERRSEEMAPRFAGLASVTAQVETGKDNIVTRAYVFEGKIEVTSLIDGRSQVLRENEVVEADRRGLGVVRIDPEKVRLFLEGMTSGMAPAARKVPQQMIEERTIREDMKRMDRLDDIKQREITPPTSPHVGPSR